MKNIVYWIEEIIRRKFNQYSLICWGSLVFCNIQSYICIIVVQFIELINKLRKQICYINKIYCLKKDLEKLLNNSNNTI